MDICVPEVVAISHLCAYEWCYPKDHKYQKIMDCLDCNTLTKVRFPRHMWYHMNLGQGFCKQVKPLILSNKVWCSLTLTLSWTEWGNREDIVQLLTT